LERGLCLQAEYKVQQAELSETKAENAKLKKKLQKAVNKLAASEEKKEKGDTKSADAATINSNPRDTSSEIDRIREIYLNPSARLPPKLIRGKTGCSYAFCALVMNRDSYALGAAVLAHRLKKLNTKADIVDSKPSRSPLTAWILGMYGDERRQPWGCGSPSLRIQCCISSSLPRVFM